MDVPTFHIVPSKIVAETIKTTHHEWLNTTGINGQKHKDSNIRSFTDIDNIYLNKWDYLGWEEK